MATLKAGLLPINPSRRDVGGGRAPDPTPFRVYVMAVDDGDQSSDVRVSRYSAILGSPDVNDIVPLIGIDLKLNIKYGDKIWVEVFYDKNLVPVFGIINKGHKWSSTVVNPAQTNETVLTYPNEHEFITKADMVGKLADLDGIIALVNTYQAASIAELTYRKNVGIITADTFNDLQSTATTQYQRVKDLITDYKKNMNKFFDAAPQVNWRKLFRTYTLIAYTTHDTNLDLDGTGIDPRPPLNTTTPTIPQASQQVFYRLVQCLTSDLYLADMCFQNRYPAKIPVPYHRPVYYFNDNGKVEDTVNTA